MLGNNDSFDRYNSFDENHSFTRIEDNAPIDCTLSSTDCEADGSYVDYKAYMHQQDTRELGHQEPIPLNSETIISSPHKKKSFNFKRPIAVALSMLTLTAFGFGSGYATGQFLNKGSSLITTAPSISSNQSNTQEILQTTSPSNGKALSVTEIANLNGNSVVEISTEVMVTGRRLQQYITQGAGSGVIITNDGYIITNNHVIDGANKINVRLKNGETYEAKLIGTDSTTDIAVIKVETKSLVPVTFGDSDQLEVGELAVAIGNPLGQLGGTVTDGIISALDREITIDGESMNLLQTNAAINPGNSGGGLFNDAGQFIGLVVAKSSGSDIEGLGFAIPANEVKTIADQLISHGYVTGRPVLGVSLLDITTAQDAMMYRVNQMGVYVAQVSLNSAADKAGFKVGDCILSINDTKVSTTSDLKKAILKHKVGEQLQVKILRDRTEMTLEPVLLESNPSK